MPDEQPLLDTAAGSDPAGLLAHAVTGEVLSQVYVSPDRLFAVLRVLDREQREQVLVGALESVGVGQEIEAHGTWEKHARHGRQLRVEHYRVLMPSSEEGIRRYLASGVVPGIGPKMAERIVARFGKDTLHIIEHYSARLLEIPGFGKKRLAELRERWGAQAEKRDAFVYLQGLGIGPAYCERLWKRYGPQAPQLVRENPYRLASEVRGIGFKTADAIAANLQIAKDNPFRLGSGVAYLLEQLTERGGHTCVPRPLVLEEAAAMLEVEPAQAEAGLARAVADGAAIVEAGGDLDWVYPRSLYAAETELAAALRRYLQQTPAAVPRQIQAGLFWATLNQAQRQAVATAFQASLSIVTGGPGVGKTTITRELVDQAQRLGWNVALAAPTGRAAKRLSESSQLPAKTIHRLLKWQPETGHFLHGPDLPLPCDLLIVDEVSMLDVRLASQLFAALDPTHTRVVLVGDRDQLPSVGPGSVLRDLIHAQALPVTHLTEVFRQAGDSSIIRNAHAVNNGQMPRLETPRGEALQDFYWIEQEDPELAVDLILRLVSDRIPKRFGLSPRGDIQVLAPMNQGPCGVHQLNQRLQETLNPPQPGTPALRLPDGTALRPGDRVMQTVNNYDLGVYNGDQGCIDQVDAAAGTLTVAFDANRVLYPPDDVEQLRLAYATTIHKSQGSEFPAVIVPLLGQHFVMLRRNLVYTAMTRARRLLVLLGSRQALAMAVRNTHQAPRYSRLAERLQTA